MTRTFDNETNVRTLLADALALLTMELTHGYNTTPKNKAIREAVEEACTALHINQEFNRKNPKIESFVEMA